MRLKNGAGSRRGSVADRARAQPCYGRAVKLLPSGLLCAALALSACKHPVTIAQERGSSGWLQVDPLGRPVAAKYDDRFRIVALDTPGFDCSALQFSEGGLVVVLVHGLKGDGVEFEDAVPVIAASKPAGMFMFRWVAFDKLDPIARRFAAGLTQLAACRPEGEILVLAHSAGGVVVSSGASGVVLPADAKDGAVKMLTVASPLAGTMNRERTEGRNESRFMLDLGTRFRTYAEAGRGVRAVHLRTSFPADSVMKPTGEFVPNDRAVGIPGAPQVDLPAELGHVESLGWVARKVADGSWREWFKGL